MVYVAPPNLSKLTEPGPAVTVNGLNLPVLLRFATRFWFAVSQCHPNSAFY